MAETKRIKSYRVGRPDGPHDQPQIGRSAYFVPVELEPDEPLENLHAEIKIGLEYLERVGLSGGIGMPEKTEGQEDIVKRIWWFVSRKVPAVVDALVEDGGIELPHSEDEYRYLFNVVPEKTGFDPDRWFDMPPRPSQLMRQVFISCGQVTEQEVALGKEIEKVVSSFPGFRGYFAQNQSSLSGVTDNILKALANSAALVCVMHQRGEVARPDGPPVLRGSVWIEQEIAIAAFMQQVLELPLQIKLYCLRGLCTEGLRQQILLHPVYFDNHGEILADLRRWLPSVTEREPATRRTLSVEEENRIIEQGIREYPRIGDVKKFLDRYPSVTAADKRRMHPAIVNGARLARGGSAKQMPEDNLREMYPDE